MCLNWTNVFEKKYHRDDNEYDYDDYYDYVDNKYVKYETYHTYPTPVVVYSVFATIVGCLLFGIFICPPITIYSTNGNTIKDSNGIIEYMITPGDVLDSDIKNTLPINLYNNLTTTESDIALYATYISYKGFNVIHAYSTHYSENIKFNVLKNNNILKKYHTHKSTDSYFGFIHRYADHYNELSYFELHASKIN